LSPHRLALHFSFSNLVLLNLCAFASLVAGRLVFPLFTTFLLSFMHPTFFISFHPFYVEILGRLIWLSKKRKERNNKEKSKGTVQNHKQKKEKKESERRNQKLASKLSNSAPLIFGKQDHPILCAIFSSRDLVPPLHLCTPTFHAPLPFSVRFHLVPAAFSTCLHPYSTLHLLIDCANPCSKVKPFLQLHKHLQRVGCVLWQLLYPSFFGCTAGCRSPLLAW
jgi:hypothetical protein